MHAVSSLSRDKAALSSDCDALRLRLESAEVQLGGARATLADAADQVDTLRAQLDAALAAAASAAAPPALPTCRHCGAARDAVLMPCRHLLLCTPCAGHLVSRTQPRCPLCREEVKFCTGDLKLA